MSHTESLLEYKYPTFSFDSDTELKLPASGELTVKFKRRSSTAHEKNGKQDFHYIIEVCELVSASEEKNISPSKKDTSAADALDGLMKKAQKEKAPTKADADEDYE